MARDDERLARSQEEPIVSGLPDAGHRRGHAPDPGLGVHLRGLADEVLVKDFPGATILRHEREMLATAVSAANDCFFCMDLTPPTPAPCWSARTPPKWSR